MRKCWKQIGKAMNFERSSLNTHLATEEYYFFSGHKTILSDLVRQISFIQILEITK